MDDGFTLNIEKEIVANRLFDLKQTKNLNGQVYHSVNYMIADKLALPFTREHYSQSSIPLLETTINDAFEDVKTIEYLDMIISNGFCFSYIINNYMKIKNLQAVKEHDVKALSNAYGYMSVFNETNDDEEFTEAMIQYSELVNKNGVNVDNAFTFSYNKVGLHISDEITFSIPMKTVRIRNVGKSSMNDLSRVTNAIIALGWRDRIMKHLKIATLEQL